MFAKHNKLTPAEYLKYIQSLIMKDKEWLLKIKEQMMLMIHYLNSSNMYDTKLYINVQILHTKLINIIYQLEDAYDDARDTLYKYSYRRHEDDDDY